MTDGDMPMFEGSPFDGVELPDDDDDDTLFPLSESKVYEAELIGCAIWNKDIPIAFIRDARVQYLSPQRVRIKLEVESDSGHKTWMLTLTLPTKLTVDDRIMWWHRHQGIRWSHPYVCSTVRMMLERKVATNDKLVSYFTLDDITTF